MSKELKYFTNGRGWNYLPDFPERFPGGSRVLTDKSVYKATDNVHAFWTFYDEEVIEETIQKIRRQGVNNIRVWFDYYLWEVYKNYPEERNPYTNNVKHLVRTLENNYMYCNWVFFDSLVTPQFEPTAGIEHLEYIGWKYFPASSLGEQSNFMDNSGIPYIEDMCRLTSGSQASFLYEFSNELKISQFTSGNIVKAVSAMYRCTSANPEIKRALGVVLQHPFYGLSGAVGVGADLNEQYLIHLSTTGLNCLTVHPYTSFDEARSIQVNLALSAAYDLNIPIYFTEGAYALAFNSHVDWMQWCEASGLGWNLYQGFSPGYSGTVYRDIVGIWHSDMEVRLSSVNNYLTGLAVKAGYDPEWIQPLNYKTDYGPLNANGISTYWSPPKGSRESQLRISQNWLPSSSPYYERYRLGGLEQELNENIPIGVIQNWGTSTMDLSTVRNLYLSEAGAQTHFYEEYRFQLGGLKTWIDFIYFTASGWGLNHPTVSSYFSQWNTTNSDYTNLLASATYQATIEYPNCLVPPPGESDFCKGSCLFGPNCVGGVFQNNGLDIIDATAYTAWHKRWRDQLCELGNRIGIFSC